MKLEKDFKGECKGVRLINRGVNDPHISIEILTEDDENWFVSTTSPFSSGWIDDLIVQLQLAKAYMETQEPDIYEGQQYGWKFKLK